MELNFNSREYLKGNIRSFKVAVFGSRTLKDERVKTIILEKINSLGTNTEEILKLLANFINPEKIPK